MPRRAKNAGKRTTTGVEAVDRAIQILNCFNDGKPQLSLAELAASSGLYKSTILRVLNSLEAGGLVLRDDDKSYRFGPKLMQWGSLYQKSLRLDHVIRPVLRGLVEAAGESASFFRRDGDSRICLFREDSRQNVRDQIREGDILPLEVGAAGRLLLDFGNIAKPASKRRALFAKLPYVSIGERDTAAAGLAAPVFSAREGLLGALTLSGSITRFTASRIVEMSQMLLQASTALSATLGGTDMSQ